jgi:hypothetical protein
MQPGEPADRPIGDPVGDLGGKRVVAPGLPADKVLGLCGLPGAGFEVERRSLFWFRFMRNGHAQKRRCSHSLEPFSLRRPRGHDVHGGCGVVQQRMAGRTSGDCGQNITKFREILRLAVWISDVRDVFCSVVGQMRSDGDCVPQVFRSSEFENLLEFLMSPRDEPRELVPSPLDQRFRNPHTNHLGTNDQACAGRVNEFWCLTRPGRRGVELR